MKVADHPVLYARDKRDPIVIFCMLRGLPLLDAEEQIQRIGLQSLAHKKRVNLKNMLEFSWQLKTSVLKKRRMMLVTPNLLMFIDKRIKDEKANILKSMDAKPMDLQRKPG